MKKLRVLLPILLFTVVFVSCKRRVGLPFGDVKGIHYIEVRRQFVDGLVFDKQGYQLSPVWQFHFISDDSVRVYSPKAHKYYGFHVYYDHDKIFNMIDSWLQLKTLTPDSLVFRALRVDEKRQILEDDEGSKVYMTFYSESYLKKKGAEVIKRMGAPTKKDTVFMRERSKIANAILDSAFSARNPVVLKSDNRFVKVELVQKSRSPLDEFDPAEDYMYPEYNITIHHAYEDFGYSFSAYVDALGMIHFRKSNIPYSHEFKDSYENAIKGIISGYLTKYINVTPGNTLGIAHTSMIELNVTGKRD
jgi:hypothetical protein